MSNTVHDEHNAHIEHEKREHLFLTVRNIAVVIATILFLLSFHSGHLMKVIAYFFGAVAYCSEILMLTDGFRKKQPLSEMLMPYCFAPLYVLMGFSYLGGH